MWGAIKKAINSNLNKSLDILIQEKTTETNGKVDSTDTKIGATNDTGGTASAGSVFAKLNKLLTDWTTTRAGYLDTINTNVGTLINGRVVKSVQYGVLIPTAKTKVSTISHNAVDTQRSVIFITGGRSSASAYVPPYIKGRTSNNFVLELDVGYGEFSPTYPIGWQVIEFYEIKKEIDMIYAQLDSNNVCIGISQLSGEVQADNMLQIENYDVTLLGKKYENGKWIDLPKPPLEPTEEELIIAQTLINQATIKEQLNVIDETNSQIILKLAGGN